MKKLAGKKKIHIVLHKNSKCRFSYEISLIQFFYILPCYLRILFMFRLNLTFSKIIILLPLYTFIPES